MTVAFATALACSHCVSFMGMDWSLSGETVRLYVNLMIALYRKLIIVVTIESRVQLTT
jgi:hypothetical protein